MQLEIVFLVVEHAAAAAEVAPGDVLDRLVGDQEDVELGARLVDQPAQLQPVIVGLHLLDRFIAHPVQVAVENRKLVGRFESMPGRMITDWMLWLNSTAISASSMLGTTTAS